ncbi:MAG: HAMP domain-containing sensor histidine kinase [Bacillota bacterium]|nr:HAMP domain-containing sensor histidine kinase [Bacillota bacterium]
MKGFRKWWIYLIVISFLTAVLSFFTGLIVGYNIMRFGNRFGVLVRSPIIPIVITAGFAIVGIGGFISIKIFRPISQIANALGEVGNGNFSVRLNDWDGLDEVRALSHTFNEMVQELEETETLRNDFVSNVSHEFKTPLASIEGYATLMMSPEASAEEMKNYARRIMTSTSQMSVLIGNILALSRLDTGGIPEEKTAFSLDEQLREAILSLEPRWSEKNIAFDMDLPMINITGYEHLLFQVWTNIYANAVKFSPEGGCIRTTLEQRGKRVFVTIGDEGIGMTPQQLRHAFDKFYQADTAHKAEGNGLGLALAKKIVEISGGKISAKSEPGKGTEFMIEL